MPGQPRLVKNKRFLNIQMTKNQFEIKGTVLFPATSAQVTICMPSSQSYSTKNTPQFCFKITMYEKLYFFLHIQTLWFNYGVTSQ